MIDMHYDLLTVIYRAHLEKDYTYVAKWLKNYNSKNVTGLVANLYFMSRKEMDEELGKNYYNDNKTVTEMFGKSIELLEKVMPNGIDVVYAIEGCDYIEDINELETLYEMGLRSICLVWNEPNKYGSGNRGNYGLTSEGITFIRKAIELGIAIDLSHANEQTFYDIINVIKEYRLNGYNPIVFASHSNSRTLCDIPRNLTDEQLHAIKEIGGYVGVLSHRDFVIKQASKKNISTVELRKAYIEHIVHIGNIIGTDKLLLSSDDMEFYYYLNDGYEKLPIYEYSSIKDEIKKDLLTVFSKEEAEKILFKNAIKIFKKLKKK